MLSRRRNVDRTIPVLALTVALAATTALAHSRASTQDPNEARRAAAARSFVAQCAPCHGELGDGKGTTQLDRQARSFKDGGFSYGNTLPALYRSITTGIPGTPMPGFEFALAEDERRALAEYVLSLGPQDAIADTQEKVMVVGERTLVVRGLLPPIVEGASERTRGLLIGTPAGTSFEYRADDVRLLGVRQGEFVERRDWVGRGGDALRPLGKLVHVFGNGDPRAPFVLLVPREGGQPQDPPSGEERGLFAVLLRTAAAGDRASIQMRIDDPAHRSYATVEEELSTRVTSVGSGWVRRFHYTGGPATGRIVHRFAEDASPEARAAVFTTASADPDAPGPEVNWSVWKRSEGGFEARGVISPNSHGVVKTQSSSAVWLDLAPGRTADVEVETLLLPAWSEAIQASMLAEAQAR
jgi:mono/diheme cytochrome c family protein